MLLEFLGGPLPWIAAAARAAQATGLPVWVAMSAQESDVDKRVLLGRRDHPSSPQPKVDPDIRFVDAIDTVMAVAGEALLVLHSDVPGHRPGPGRRPHPVDGTAGRLLAVGGLDQPQLALREHDLAGKVS
jgi:hypothetical protein